MYSKFIKLVVIRSILVCCGFAGRVLNGRFPQLCRTRERSTSQIVKSRHKSGMRQFNKDKPIRWGIKLWVLADSSNGYTIDLNVYIGKVEGQDVSANGLGYDVVMKLMNPYFHQGYHLYVDNFYTSVTLFQGLFCHGCWCYRHHKRI